jgi:hypothetical protein
VHGVLSRQLGNPYWHPRGDVAMGMGAAYGRGVTDHLVGHASGRPRKAAQALTSPFGGKGISIEGYRQAVAPTWGEEPMAWVPVAIKIKVGCVNTHEYQPQAGNSGARKRRPYTDSWLGMPLTGPLPAC